MHTNFTINNEDLMVFFFCATVVTVSIVVIAGCCIRIANSIENWTLRDQMNFDESDLDDQDYSSTGQTHYTDRCPHGYQDRDLCPMCCH